MKLGETPLEVSRLGLGLAALGRPAYINVGHADDLGPDTDESALRARAHEVLDTAYRGGVRYFDAARSYGKAEEFLGSWLVARGLSPRDVTVGSKWGYTYTADWRLDAPVTEVKELSLPNLRRQWAQSKTLLGDHLQLYQIHSATIDSGVLEDPAVLDELARLRAEGTLIGFTVTGPGQGETIERALQVGGFDTVQATWNLLERSAGAALGAARSAGVGVIVKEALANGRLTARGDTPLLREVARRAGVAPDALALAAVLAQPWGHVTLSGAATVDTLSSNLSALDVAADEELLERLGPLIEEPAGYWERRSEMRWN